MSRPFFGSGFFPSDTPPPDAYVALVDAFGGDEAAADFYLADLVGWATGAEAQDLLDAAQDVGDPADAIAALRSAPVQRAMDFAAELDAPANIAIAVPSVPLAGMPGLATDL